MQTHTIALFDDWLIATAPDNDAATMNERLANASGISFDETDLEVISGLTLIRTKAEAYAAEESGAEIIYSGTDQGHLQDENGSMIYHAAARLPKQARQ
jgi:hypothetical protein